MWLSPYSTASHAKGRFFCTFLSKGKKISSNHDTSVLIVFIFSHNMALFLLSFSPFFPCLSAVIVVILSCGHKFEGTHLKEEKKIGPHMQVFFVIVEAETQCGSRALVFGSLFLTFLTFLHYLSCLHSNSILHLKQHNNLFRYYFWRMYQIQEYRTRWSTIFIIGEK